jgi:hypothetical protein
LLRPEVRFADKPGAIPSFNDMDVIRLGASFQLVESSRALLTHWG